MNWAHDLDGYVCLLDRSRWRLCTTLWAARCHGNATRYGLHRVGAHWQRVCMLGDSPTQRRCNLGLPYWEGRDKDDSVTPCDYLPRPDAGCFPDRSL